MEACRGERAFSIDEGYVEASRELDDRSNLDPDGRDEYRDELLEKLSALQLRKVLDEEYERQNRNIPVLGGLYEQLKRRFGRSDSRGSRTSG